MTVHIDLEAHEAATLIAYLRAQQGYGGPTLISVRSKVERALEWHYAESAGEIVLNEDRGGLPRRTVAAPTESELRALSGDR